MLSRFVRKAVFNCHSSPMLMSQRFLSTPEKERPFYCIREDVTVLADSSDPSQGAATELIDAEAPKPLPFYGPQRDNVNFPKIKQLDKPVPTRLCMFPESWFKFLYPKLGVTGPYTLGIGFIYFLISKELYLIGNYESKHTIAFFLWIYIIVRTPIGEKLRKFVWDDECGLDEALVNLRKHNEEMRTDAIAHEKKEQWRLEGKHLLFEAKKANVALQLEALYRENFMNTFNELKRRLDYQVEVNKIDERIKQQFMIKWVLERVNESLAQTSEKENLKQCIANLNALAARV